MATIEEGLKSLLKSLKGTYTVKLELSDEDSAKKLEWLKADNRDFLKVTPQLQKVVASQFVDSIVNHELDTPAAVEKAVNQTFQDVGEAILEHIAFRFQDGKRDVRMRPLTREYIKRKGHNRVGILSGDLFRDILNAKVTLKKSSD